MSQKSPLNLSIFRAFCVICALAASACTRVADQDEPDAGPKLIDVAGDAGDVYYIDIQFPDVPKKDTGNGDTAGETTADVLEQCGNLIDDNGDGRVDEGCWPAPNLRSDQSWRDFGVLKLQAKTAPVATVTFDAPSKNMGITLLARDIDQEKLYVWAESIVSPASVEVLAADAWATSFNRSAPSIGGGTALIGMSPQVTLAAGPWNFAFTRSKLAPLNYGGTPSAGYLHVGVVSRAEIPLADPVTIDIDVYLVGGTAMPAAAMGSSPQWLAIANKVEAIWSGANLHLGKIQFIDLDGDDGKKFKFLDNVLAGGLENELTQIYKVTGAMRPQSTAATLLLVGALNDNGQQVAAGLSQLAGISGYVGSRMSGMAVAIDDKEWASVVALGPDGASIAADRWGVTIAHEMGHFMGLWHTDEYDGKLHDPIADTPICDKTGTLTAEGCPAQAKYLMFWSPKGSIVTLDQAATVRHSTNLR